MHVSFNLMMVSVEATKPCTRTRSISPASLCSRLHARKKIKKILKFQCQSFFFFFSYSTRVFKSSQLNSTPDRQQSRFRRRLKVKKRLQGNSEQECDARKLKLHLPRQGKTASVLLLLRQYTSMKRQRRLHHAQLYLFIFFPGIRWNWDNQITAEFVHANRNSTNLVDRPFPSCPQTLCCCQCRTRLCRL